MEEDGRIHVAPDARSAGSFAAKRIAESARSAVRDRGFFGIAVSGGETPKVCFEALAAAPLRDEVDWGRWQLFLADERCVPSDDPASNFRLVRENLLARVSLPAGRVHRWPTESAAESAAFEYERELETALGAPPVFDLVQLGLGSDGHTASLFPGTEALAERTRSAAVGLAPTPPRRRLTLTLPVLNRARGVLFLVVGEEKAEIVRRVIEENDPRLPASLVRPERLAAWVLDAAAASRLSTRFRAGSV
jgi:6-phosphogluconolactonase